MKTRKAVGPRSGGGGSGVDGGGGSRNWSWESRTP